MNLRWIVALCLAVHPLAALPQTAPEAPAKSVQISGRVIFPNGSPVSSSVSVRQIAPDGPRLNLLTDEHGVFAFLGLSGKMYRISVGFGLKTPPITVDASGGKDIDVGDLVFEHCPAPTVLFEEPPTSPPALIGDLKPDQITIDASRRPGIQWTGIATPFSLSAELGNSLAAAEAPEPPPCWSGPSLERRNEWEGLSSITFARFITVEAFVGAKVKSIRVIRYDPSLTQAQVKEAVRKAWLGTFRYATSQITWAEGNFWNIEAEVDFEDGRRRSLLTDGMHVEVQDWQGKRWYLREWPAVD